LFHWEKAIRVTVNETGAQPASTEKIARDCIRLGAWRFGDRGGYRL
jgi:hypothetical protein